MAEITPIVVVGSQLGRSDWLRGAQRARRLATVSLAWLCFEGAATTTAGLLAGSAALLANGLDGAIEGLASIIVLWRFSGSRTLSPSSERRAQQLVALSFFLLAPFIAFEAAHALLVEHHANTTLLGIGLSIATLCICPWLGRAKLRLGEQLASPATAGEGRQNLICAHLAVGVLAGLLANTLLGIWWLDPVVALGIAAVAIIEGRRAWRGESCGCTTCPQQRSSKPAVLVPAEENKQLVRRLVHEAVADRNPDVLDELTAGEFARAARRWVQPFQNAFPDFEMEIVDLIAEGDRVVAHFRCSGTHRGEWLGVPATGRRFEQVDEIYIFTVRDGKLVSAVGVEDNLKRMRQLRIEPAAGPTTSP